MNNKDFEKMLKTIFKTMERIDSQRADLRARREQIDRDRTRGTLEKAYSFDVDEVLKDAQADSEREAQYIRLKLAEEQPYYADAEYRRETIPFKQAVSTECENERRDLDRKITAAKKEMAALKAAIIDYERQKIEITDKWVLTAIKIGLPELQNYLRYTQNLEAIAKMYQEKCESYK